MATDTFSCSLCLDLFSDNGEEDYFVSTDCGHIFHYMCLKPAYENGFKTCPICRQEMKLDNLRKLYGLVPKNKRPPPNFKLQYSDTANMREPKDDYKFKIILVGDAGVGKSSLMQRYSDGFYNSKLFSTVGCDWRTKTLIVGGKTINLSIWDTVGQERHRSLITNYVRDAHGALVCYDITNEDSFTEIEYWLNFVKDHGLHDCVKILVGNKTDMEDHRQVPKPHGKALAARLHVPFFETSAKDAYNVEATFRTLAAKILETDSLLKEIEDKKTKGGTVRLSKDQENVSNPLHTVCSYGWHWAKVGVVGAARGIKSGWGSVTSSSRGSTPGTSNHF